MNPQKLAISYTRFSTIGQADGDSIRRQTEAAEDYCKRNGLTLTDQYRLQDSGKSAFKGKNRSATSALGQLEKQVAEGKIPTGTVLIVENLDRLSRQDVVTAQHLLTGLLLKGLEIVALADGERRYTHESASKNPLDLMLSVMISSRAHEESATKSYRAKESWRNRKKMATEGKHINIVLPAWLENENGKYTVPHEKEKIIKQIFKWYLTGYGAQSIAAMLCKKNIPNIAKERSGRTDRWHSTYIVRLLKSKEVLGYYTGVSPEIPNYFPKIISEDDFYAVQAKLKARLFYKGQRNQNPQPFSHLLKCSLCGEGIIRTMSKGGYVYLQCQGARVHMCRTEYMDYTSTVDAFLRIISKVDTSATTTDEASVQLSASGQNQPVKSE